MLHAEDQRRGHAVIEQVFADWNDKPFAHLPYVRVVSANAAWLACAVISGNLLRAAAALPASPAPKPVAPPSAAT
jgi:hypothetical protein